MIKTITFLLITFLIFPLNKILAQHTITTAGTNAYGSGGTVSYTIGQDVYTTDNGTNGSVAQGVQQPFEISIIIGIEEAKNITLDCDVYPNPTKDYLKLKIENYKIDNTSYQLFDLKGVLLDNKGIVENITNIEMKNYAPSVYFIKVNQGNKEIKSFKIIKN